MRACSSAISLVSHVVERQDSIDVDYGILGAITVQVELLGTATESHPAFKLNVGDSEF